MGRRRLGRGPAEGAEELVAEGVHWLERGGGAGQQTVLVVSHVTPIKILLCRALGVPLSTVYRLYLGSACINEIQWHGRGFAAVHCVNDTSHLP